MRVFIGIKAPDKIQNQIIEWQEKRKDLPVRFIQTKNLHLTLAPPWHESNIKKLLKNLNKFAFPKTFEVAFDQVSKGPSLRPRLIWITGPEQSEFTKLKKEFARFLKKPKEKHSAPHITIARFKIKEAALVPEINELIELKFDVSEITLFESKLLPSGADYFPIEHLKLAI